MVDRDKTTRGNPEKDAEGQFVRTRKGRHNDGVSSAEPRVITGDEDATFDDDPKPERTVPKGRRS
jgi:hypothetical protein